LDLKSNELNSKENDTEKDEINYLQNEIITEDEISKNDN
jgi:hypothetical protein